jgi:hypothetical protein
MIITETKPLEEVLQTIAGMTHIFLVGCGECATVCKTGGEDQLKALQATLESHGKIVVGACIPKAPCSINQGKAEIAKQMPHAKSAQGVLVCACGLGVQAVRECVRWGAEVVPACNTICGAVVDGPGRFSERCSFCGDCLLAHTAAICPVTRCAKGLLNGPCGGMKRGKCEVDQERDCAWVLIYQALDQKNAVAQMRLIRQPKDHKRAAQPHYIQLKEQ